MLASPIPPAPPSLPISLSHFAREMREKMSSLNRDIWFQIQDADYAIARVRITAISNDRDARVTVYLRPRHPHSPRGQNP